MSDRTTVSTCRKCQQPYDHFLHWIGRPGSHAFWRHGEPEPLTERQRRLRAAVRAAAEVTR